MDVAMFKGALAGLSSAVEIAKSIKDVNDTVKINAKVIELQTVILAAQGNVFSAQAEQLALAETIRELKEEIAAIKAWEHEKSRYVLKSVRQGCYAYVLKDSEKGSEPPHWICSNCYQNNKKSILQATNAGGRGFISYCPACKNTVDVSFNPNA